MQKGVTHFVIGNEMHVSKWGHKNDQINYILYTSKSIIA